MTSKMNTKRKEQRKGSHVKKVVYWTADREAGNKIEAFDSMEEAEEAIIDYESEDLENKEFTPGFYSVIED